MSKKKETQFYRDKINLLNFCNQPVLTTAILPLGGGTQILDLTNEGEAGAVPASFRATNTPSSQPLKPKTKTKTSATFSIKLTSEVDCY